MLTKCYFKVPMNATKNSPIYSNLLKPQKIAENITDFPIKDLTRVDSIFTNLFPSHFFDRYIAGNENLKELRVISRHKLALASSGIGYVEPDVQALLTQTQQYTKAENYLFCQNKITLTCLTKVNKILAAENKKAGKIRTTQTWIGAKKIENAIYVCPPPNEINKLLETLVAFINNDNIPIEARIIIGHAHLLDIHPFYDGNGRTARALMGALLKKHFVLYINPSLFRLHSKTTTVFANEYINAIHSFHKNNIPITQYHSFWYESFQWAIETQVKINELVQQVKNKIKSKILLVNLSPEGLILIDYLWQQPVICEQGLNKKFGWSKQTIQQQIMALLQLQLIEPKKLRAIKNAIVFSCPIILDTWNKMDDILFEAVDHAN